MRAMASFQVVRPPFSSLFCQPWNSRRSALSVPCRTCSLESDWVHCCSVLSDKLLAKWSEGAAATSLMSGYSYSRESSILPNWTTPIKKFWRNLGEDDTRALLQNALPSAIRRYDDCYKRKMA